MKRNLFVCACAGIVSTLLGMCRVASQEAPSKYEQQVTKGPENETSPCWDDKDNLTFCRGTEGFSKGLIDTGGGGYLAFLSPPKPGEGRAVDAEYKNERGYKRGAWARWSLRSGDRVEVVEGGLIVDFATNEFRTQREIVLIRASDILKLITNATANATPCISADGKTVLFCHGTEIWRTDIGTDKPGSPIRLTKDSGVNCQPVIAPDGKAIYFVSDRMGKPDIWLMNLDGSSQRQLTNGALLGPGLALSPDGSKLAFSSLKSISKPTAASGNIWIMNTNGTGLRQLTSDGSSQWPSFSRDGRKIAYQSYRSGNWDIWVCDVAAALSRVIPLPTGEVQNGIALSGRLKNGDATALAELALSTRPANNPPSWTFAVPLNGSESKTFVGFSMKVAQALVLEAERQKTDFRQNIPDVWHLGGITKPLAFVFDRRIGDVVLVGERGQSGILTLDDLVVALRARFLNADRDPGVSVMPTLEIAEMAEVRFFGGNENSRFGKTILDAYRSMEMIALGLGTHRISGMKSYADLVAESGQEMQGLPPEVRARFWFYPIVNRVNIIGDVVLLEKFQMGMFTEVLYAEVDGKPIKDIAKFEYPPAGSFSRSMSERYAQLTEMFEEFAGLENLSRLAALAKGLTHADAKPDLDYWLEHYRPAAVDTPRKVPVLRAAREVAGKRIEIRLW